MSTQPEERPLYSVTIEDEPIIKRNKYIDRLQFFYKTKGNMIFRNNFRRKSDYKITHSIQLLNIDLSLIEAKIKERLSKIKRLSKTETKKRSFILSIVKNISIERENYLTFKEIAFFIYFLQLLFTRTIKVEFSGIPNLLSLNYDSLVHIYELFFTNLYYTIDLHDDVYNSLMEVLDEELNKNKEDSSLNELQKKENIEEIYINCLIDCFLITPLSKFGNCNNDTECFTNYLGYMALHIYSGEIEEQTILNGLIDILKPLDLGVIRRA